MELFDTHFHLGDAAAPEEVMAAIRADQELVRTRLPDPVTRLHLLCAGDSLEGSRQAAEFAAVVPDAYFAAGVHPHEADEYRKTGGDFSEFRNNCKLKAVGEIGLDYFYGLSVRDNQLSVLEEFLELALEWRLPAMLHLRDRDGAVEAYEDALTLLRDFVRDGGRFVIHCYAGDARFAEEFLALGGYFGVTGLYMFKAADNIRDVVARLPLERLLIETDAPYLAPVPFRGRRNSPGMVGLVAAAGLLSDDR